MEGPGACWPASLAYLESFRPVRELAFENKVATYCETTSEVFLCSSCTHMHAHMHIHTGTFAYKHTRKDNERCL